MIPFQTQIVSALVGAILATWATASFLDTRHDLQSAKVTIASQATQTQAQTVVLEKTEKATTITVDNTAALQKELLDAKDKINALQRGIANGTIGMRVNIISPSSQSSGVQSSSNSGPVPQVISAELDPTTANALIDLTATGDEYARQYNGLHAWCESQLSNQRESK